MVRGLNGRSLEKIRSHGTTDVDCEGIEIVQRVDCSLSI